MDTTLKRNDFLVIFVPFRYSLICVSLFLPAFHKVYLHVDEKKHCNTCWKACFVREINSIKLMNSEKVDDD